MKRTDSWIKPGCKEWLETDGLGGFASSTTSGVHTRRYHGWLFISGKEPGERWLGLSKLEDACAGPDGKWELSSNLYPGAVYPHGMANLWAFSHEPFPKFIFKLGKAILEREIFMVKGMPGVFCIYRLGEAGQIRGQESQVLTLRPLCNSRSYHHLGKEGSWNPEVFCLDDALVLEGHEPGGCLAMACSEGCFTKEIRWYKNMVYPTERKRGLDYTEDHFSPGYFTCKVTPGRDVVFWAGPVYGKRRVRTVYLRGKNAAMPWGEWRENLWEHAGKLRKYEAARRRSIGAAVGGGVLSSLRLAADQFIVESRTGTSIIAGYHWFGEWGRDTFISLPGLLLATGRFKESEEVFLRFAGQMKEGLVPNCLVEGAEAIHNSVDSSLWFVDALAKHQRAARDWRLVESLMPKVGQIIDNYMKGTDGGIKMHPSGLLRAGDMHTQLTWMDARVNGFPVTPRYGFPVEVNALWIRALFLYGNWLKRLSFEGYDKYILLARKAAKEFRRSFIWPGVGLYDRIDEEGPVFEIRPNQIIAGAIAELSLPRHVAVEIWTTAFEKLLSPHGVRTLAPFSPQYRGEYGGGPAERDSAYHQGTAWPWLFGPLFDLAVGLQKKSPSLEQEGGVSKGASGLEKAFGLILSHLLRLDDNVCLGTIFEVGSGDAPHDEGGTVSQAWSVAEILRIVSSFGGSLGVF